MSIIRSHKATAITSLLYVIFIALSFILGFERGQKVGYDFISFGRDMIVVMPPVFILIGLFEVWISPASVERHCGSNCGFTGYLWAILLAGTAVGGIQIALPIAYALYKKGARLRIIFTYNGVAAICRIPLTTFEISFLGPKFTLIRWLVSLPLVILTAIFLENYLNAQDYKMPLAGMQK